ncbi:MAG TPA: Pvc16 family protein, partial [Vampirovibrionales bacterium]
MIPAVAQTLAEILAGGTSAISMEQIDFNSPNSELNHQAPRLNLYCYDVRENPQMQISPKQTDPSTIWVDVSFLITAWDKTALGEQYLLSEALTVLLPYHSLPSERLAPALQGKGTV